jgi:hypothetical protein
MNALQRNAMQSGGGSAAAFQASLMKFTRTLELREQAVFEGALELMYESIVHGSHLTGAPGQPVRTGQLRDSWKVEHLSPTVAKVTTSLGYAWPVEHNAWGEGEATVFRNHGPHSVKRTRAGFARIVDFVRRRAQQLRAA